MARQAKTSTRRYDDKHKVKCASCGNESSKVTPRSIRGIVRWICYLCNDRMNAKNGAA